MFFYREMNEIFSGTSVKYNLELCTTLDQMGSVISADIKNNLKVFLVIDDLST